jgi:hypothetical protein
LSSACRVIAIHDRIRPFHTDSTQTARKPRETARGREPPIFPARSDPMALSGASHRKQIPCTFEATVLAGDSPEAFNDVEHPGRVAPEQTKLTFTKGTATLPPHSLTIVRFTQP